MASQLQHRRGTSADTLLFTGATGELTFNTTNNSIHAHDGITANGFELARTDLNNISNDAFAAKANAAGVGGGGGGGGTSSADVHNITQSSPAIVTTIIAHEFSDGDQVTFTDIGGMTELNGNAYFADVISGTTFAIYADEAITTPLSTLLYSAYSASGSVTASEPLGAPANASYVVISANNTLQHERTLQAGAGLVLTDGGAGGGVSIVANFSNSVTSNLGSATAGISTDVSRSDHVHAMPTPVDIGAVLVSRNITAGSGLSGGGQLSADIVLSLDATLSDLSDVTVGTLANGDALIYNSATSRFENSQNLAKISVQRQGSVVGLATAVDVINFTGVAFTDGSVSVTAAPGDNTLVNVNLPRIHSEEQIQDIVGSMVSPVNTENGITVTYDDSSARLNFDTADFAITLTGDVQGSATVTNLGDVSITTTMATDSTVLGTNTQGNYVAMFGVGSALSLTNSTGTTEGAGYTVSLDTSSNSYIESVQDIVGSMVSPVNAETGIAVTYDDSTGKLNFNTDDFTITLGGDLSGTATITDLGNVTLTAQIANDAVALGENTTGQYVATLTAGAGTSLTNSAGSTTEGANYTISMDTSSDGYIESVQDIMGGMVTSNNETGIAVTYDDSTGKLNFNTDDFTITLGGDLSGTATITDLGNVTLTAQIANDAVALGENTTGQYASTIVGSGTGLSITQISASDATAYTITSDATSANTAGTIVSRDASGNFTAGIITASLTGSASLNVLKTGDVMTGALTLNAAPTANMHAATKQYVDSNSNLLDDEAVQDIVGGMVSSNAESGIAVTYDDSAGKLNFNVSDPSITLTGDVTGSATMTNLGNVSIATSMDAAPAAHTHTDYVAKTGDTMTGALSLNAAPTSNMHAATKAYVDSASSTGAPSSHSHATTDITNFAEEVEDVIGDMVSDNTESGITVTYIDNSSGQGKLNFNVNDPSITLTGDVTGSATMTNLGNVSIATSMDAVVLGTGTTGDYVKKLVAGSGVTITNNTGEGATPIISVGQSVSTSSSPTFSSLTVTGNLTVSGATTTINTETINLADNIMRLNSNYPNNSAPTEDAGFEINRGNLDSVAFVWDETNDRWSVGTETMHAGLFSGTALSAQYADIAENYTSDEEYAPGTVVMLGGQCEVTRCTEYASRKVAGVVSTNPAFTMNDELDGQHVTVALIGRVPCNVTGTIEIGDLIVASGVPGFAESWKDDDSDPRMGTIIGKSLENKTTPEDGVIEIIIGLR
jgi:hypothetical protein